MTGWTIDVHDPNGNVYLATVHVEEFQGEAMIRLNLEDAPVWISAEDFDTLDYPVSNRATELRKKIDARRRKAEEQA